MFEYLFRKPEYTRETKANLGYVGYEVTELKTYRPKPTYFVSRPAKRWKK